MHYHLDQVESMLWNHIHTKLLSSAVITKKIELKCGSSSEEVLMDANINDFQQKYDYKYNLAISKALNYMLDRFLTLWIKASASSASCIFYIS